MIVYLLYERDPIPGYGHGYDEPEGSVFSSVGAAVSWLRRSRPFLRDSGGPIVPTPDGDGGFVRLNDRYSLARREVDPPPLTQHDMTPYAQGGEGRS